MFHGKYIFFDLLSFGNDIPLLLRPKFSEFTDKVKLFPNKVNRVILCYYFIQYMTTYNALHDKGLNLIQGIMW